LVLGALPQIREREPRNKSQITNKLKKSIVYSFEFEYCLELAICFLVLFLIWFLYFGSWSFAANQIKRTKKQISNLKKNPNSNKASQFVI
jgi:hypothetical protein